mmetsp:Transcript_25013/g.82518  ORF Transcript_25013/g.82518 Transcript_25013/m.82518 type:complete len:225 (+) Transcript_25013:2460-3134(+)
MMGLRGSSRQRSEQDMSRPVPVGRAVVQGDPLSVAPRTAALHRLGTPGERLALILMLDADVGVGRARLRSRGASLPEDPHLRARSEGAGRRHAVGAGHQAVAAARAARGISRTAPVRTAYLRGRASRVGRRTREGGARGCHSAPHHALLFAGVSQTVEQGVVVSVAFLGAVGTLSSERVRNVCSIGAGGHGVRASAHGLHGVEGALKLLIPLSRGCVLLSDVGS